MFMDLTLDVSLRVGDHPFAVLQPRGDPVTLSLPVALHLSLEYHSR